MKTPIKIGIVVLILLILAQFFSPEKNEGNLKSVEPFLADTNPSEQVKTILKESCYDCHSNITQYPAYYSITPVNYWMAHHIEEGKEHLDFSEWESYSAKKKEHKLEEIAEEVEEKEMPLASYTWTHSEAKLTKAQIDAVMEWANLARVKYQLQINPQ